MTLGGAGPLRMTRGGDYGGRHRMHFAARKRCLARAMRGRGWALRDSGEGRLRARERLGEQPVLRRGIVRRPLVADGMLKMVAEQKEEVSPCTPPPPFPRSRCEDCQGSAQRSADGSGSACTEPTTRTRHISVLAGLGILSARQIAEIFGSTRSLCRLRRFARL